MQSSPQTRILCERFSECKFNVLVLSVLLKNRSVECMEFTVECMEFTEKRRIFLCWMKLWCLTSKLAMKWNAVSCPFPRLFPHPATAFSLCFSAQLVTARLSPTGRSSRPRPCPPPHPHLKSVVVQGKWVAAQREGRIVLNEERQTDKELPGQTNGEMDGGRVGNFKD